MMPAIPHGGCTNTAKESALKVDSGRKKSLVTSGNRTRASKRMDFQSVSLPTELSRPYFCYMILKTTTKQQQQQQQSYGFERRFLNSLNASFAAFRVLGFQKVAKVLTSGCL